MDNDYVRHLFFSSSIVDDKDPKTHYITHDLNELEDTFHQLNDIQAMTKSDKDEFGMQHTPSRRITRLTHSKTGSRILVALKRLRSIQASKNNFRQLHPTLTLFQQLAEQHAIQHHLNMTDGQEQAKRLNAFVRHFRHEYNTASHQRKLRQYQRAAKKNLQGARRYMHSLFERYAKLLVIRIDLSYRKEAKGSITAEVARQHRQRFFKNLQAHRLFQACVGYIWKLEYGRYKGFHYHLLLFYNGNKVRQDITLGRQLGEYWRDNITEGTGHYFNCNANKERYQFPGIGLLHYTDVARKQGLGIAIQYLCKTDTYARLTLPNGARTFGRGEVLVQSGTRRGRPRLSPLAQRD